MAKEKDNPTLADKPAEVEKATEPAVKVETISVKTVAPAPAVDPAADGPGRYRVTLQVGEETLCEEIDAAGRSEAWALFCDARKSWPSPKRVDRKIEKIG